MIKLLVPKVIPLASRRYKVVQKSLRDEQALGSASHEEKQLIEIDPIQNPTGRAEILWHEIFHSIARVWQLKLDEATFGSLSEGLNQVMQDGFKIELDWSDIPNVK